MQNRGERKFRGCPSWSCMTLTPMHLSSSPAAMEGTVSEGLWLKMEGGYHGSGCLMMARSEQRGGLGLMDMKRKNRTACLAGGNVLTKQGRAHRYKEGMLNEARKEPKAIFFLQT